MRTPAKASPAPAGIRTFPQGARFDLPLETPPMEARAAEALPTEGNWQFEPKWDGFRCLAFKARDAVELRAKSGKPLALLRRARRKSLSG